MGKLTDEEIEKKALALAMQLTEFALASWTSPEAIKALLEQFGIREDEHKIYFLTSLSMLVRNRMCSDFFANTESKENLVNSIQALLDELIVRENEQTKEAVV